MINIKEQMNDITSSPYDSEETGLDLSKLWRLHTAKKVIRNYINIIGLTDQIDLKFKAQRDQDGPSYTDGKTVVIGSDIHDPKKWDSSVYLAIHEASHIRYTDFQSLKNLWAMAEKIQDWSVEKGYPRKNQALIQREMHRLCNLLEDERIDRLVLSKAAGYKKYFDAFDKQNTHIKNITIAGLLEVTGWNEEGIINLLIASRNKYLDFSLIKNTGVPELVERIKETHDCKDTGEVILLTESIYKEILDILYSKQTSEKEDRKSDSDNQDKNVNTKASKKETDGDDEQSKTSHSEDTGSTGGTPSDEWDPSDAAKSNETGDGGDGGSDGVSTTPNLPTPTSNDEVKKAKSFLQKQDDILDGTVHKKGLTREDNNLINSMGNSEFDIVTIPGNDMLPPIKNYIIRSPTPELLNNPLLNFMINSDDRDRYYIGYRTSRRMEELKVMDTKIGEGLQMGKLLASRIQLLSEEDSTKFSRQKSGKLDKRRIWAGGLEDDLLFERTELQSYKPIHLHISIDASGSMDGSYASVGSTSKWLESVKFASSIVMASHLTPKISCEVSLRYSAPGRSNTQQEFSIFTPIVYDSRLDTVATYSQRMRIFWPTETTPEGLTYEGLLKYMQQQVNSDKRVILINFSDGQPGCKLGNIKNLPNGFNLPRESRYNTHVFYQGNYALQHSKQIVEKIKSLGIEVLPYFVSHSSPSNNGFTDPAFRDFKQIYGGDSVSLGQNDLVGIVRGLNKILLKR